MPSGPPPRIPPGPYIVWQGDSIPSIAAQSGHFWQTLWDDPENASLKATRVNPNVLAAGDVVHVPEPRIEFRPCRTGKRHIFRRRGIPALLRVQLYDEGYTRAAVRFRLALDTGEIIDGTTDEKGVLEVRVSPTTRRAALEIEDDAYIYLLDIGALDPADQETGVRQRFVNLGVIAEDDDLALAIAGAVLNDADGVLQQEHDTVSDRKPRKDDE